MAVVQLDRLPEFAREVVRRIKPNTEKAFLIFLNGNLGSGKTTFVQAFAKKLGVTETIQSPTFVLMKKYEVDWRGFKNLIHIDAYRLEDPKEFVALRPEEFLRGSDNLICIEWGENIASILPRPDLVLMFSSEDMEVGERGITIWQAAD